MKAVGKKFQAVIFDCDGVLLDSNSIKEDAFASIAEKFYGPSSVEAMRTFHRKFGGLSRFKKFSYLDGKFERLFRVSHREMSDEFDRISNEKLMSCRMSEGLIELLATLKAGGLMLLVISGTPEDQLKQLLEARRLNEFFTRICGSPRSKSDHIRGLMEDGLLKGADNFVFVGDSEVDMNAAREFKNCQFYWSTEFSEYHGDAMTIRKLKSIDLFVRG
jgi:phosphoglycolate phosphatase-like HAD superfamily hydrolase